MADNSDEKCTEFKDIVKEHVHGLKSDQSDRDTSLEVDKTEINDNKTNENTEFNENCCEETFNENFPEQVAGEIDSECLMLCGKILRLIGDEATCRACGKSLRNIGDEIFCDYATRNLLNSLLGDLSERRAISETVR